MFEVLCYCACVLDSRRDGGWDGGNTQTESVVDLPFLFIRQPFVAHKCRLVSYIILIIYAMFRYLRKVLYLPHNPC